MSEKFDFGKDDFFKIDPEPHLIGDDEPYRHLPGVQMWWKAISNIARPLFLLSHVRIWEAGKPRVLEYEEAVQLLEEAYRRDPIEHTAREPS